MFENSDFVVKHNSMQRVPNKFVALRADMLAHRGIKQHITFPRKWLRVYVYSAFNGNTCIVVWLYLCYTNYIA